MRLVGLVYKMMARKVCASCVILSFLMTGTGIPVRHCFAQEAVTLPAPGGMLQLSSAFAPPLLKGIKVYRNDPFRFDFILDTGDMSSDVGTLHATSLRNDSNRLIKYFLAALTIPEKDLWVNLSPYEQDRIVPDAFGQTEMGRDLLAQDYILKQITASVIYPDGKAGKEFWGKVYAEALKRYGTTDIPVDTFNKVWIIPEKATVYENNDAAYVVESKLKVMLEEDYLALEKTAVVMGAPQTTLVTNKLGSDIVREVVLPILEKEVNEGKNFTALRQVYNSLILATWYKRKFVGAIHESPFSHYYIDQHRIVGIDIVDKDEKEKIWQQYVEAFKKGAYNLINEEYDPIDQKTIPRKYFSGGTDLAMAGVFKIKDSVELPITSPERSKVIQMEARPIDNVAMQEIFENKLYLMSSQQGLRWGDFIKVCVGLLSGLETVLNSTPDQRDTVYLQMLSNGFLNKEAESVLKPQLDSFVSRTNHDGKANYIKGEGFSFEGIRGIATFVAMFFPEFKNTRSELEILYEIAALMEIGRIQGGVQAELVAIQGSLKDVLSGAKSNEVVFDALTLQDPNISNTLLKWLGNVAELNEHPQAQAKAKDFLIYFTNRTLQENKDILDGYAEFIINKTEEAKAKVGSDGVSVAVMLTGAELLGRFLKQKTKALGNPIDFKPLLLTTAMVQNLELFYDAGTPFLTGQSIRILERYLQQEGVITSKTQQIIFIDTGFLGSLNNFTRKVYERIPREYLILSHDKSGPPWLANLAKGLNDEPQWQSADERLHRLALIIDDGFEASTTSPVRFNEQGFPDEVMPTARPWMHEMMARQFEALADNGQLTGAGTPINSLKADKAGVNRIFKSDIDRINDIVADLDGAFDKDFFLIKKGNDDITSHIVRNALQFILSSVSLFEIIKDKTIIQKKKESIILELQFLVSAFKACAALPLTYKQYQGQPKEEVYSWDVNNPNDVLHVINQLLIDVASSENAHYIEAFASSAGKYEEKLNSALKQINEIFNDYSQKLTADKAENGGIDLNSAKIDMTTKSRDGGAIKFNIDPVKLAQMQNAPGVAPVIINIRALENLQQFMGVQN
ncbi:MAG: hypothetical protein V2A70_00950 [Candidatus Omnitrophota bacterium]